MPKGLKRYYGHDYLHFLTCSCYHRQLWLNEPRRRDQFLQILEEVRQRYRFVVVAYVVMPDHIHLVISEPEIGTPSTVMQVLKQRFARQVLRSAGRSFALFAKGGDSQEQPHVWQRRFYDFNVWSGAQACRKAALHASQSGEGWPCSGVGRLGVEWLSQLCVPEEGIVKINQWPKAVMKIRTKA